MRTKKSSIVFVSILIVVSALLVAVFSPYISDLSYTLGIRKYISKDLKNVDNIVLLSHCAEVEGQRNSVAGFKEAVRQGADAVVVDICFKPDGTPVITDDYSKIETAPLLEKLFVAMNEENYSEVFVFLNLVQLSSFSVLNGLVVDNNLAARLAVMGIDEKHYELVSSDDTIVPIYLDYKITSDDSSAIDDGTFEAPEIIDKYGADGLIIDYADCNEEAIEAFDDLGIPTVVSGVDSSKKLCSALLCNASTVYVKDASASRKLLNRWTAVMQERYQSSVEKSLDELSNKSE